MEPSKTHTEQTIDSLRQIVIGAECPPPPPLEEQITPDMLRQAEKDMEARQRSGLIERMGVEAEELVRRRYITGMTPKLILKELNLNFNTDVGEVALRAYINKHKLELDSAKQGIMVHYRTVQTIQADLKKRCYEKWVETLIPPCAGQVEKLHENLELIDRVLDNGHKEDGKPLSPKDVADLLKAKQYTHSSINHVQDRFHTELGLNKAEEQKDRIAINIRAAATLKADTREGRVIDIEVEPA